MRITVNGRRIEADQLQQFRRPVIGLLCGDTMGNGSFGDDAADPAARIERGEGILEDHLDRFAGRPELFACQRRHVFSVQENRAFVRILQADETAAHAGFPGSAFANNAKRLTDTQFEADLVDGMNDAFRTAEQATAGPIGLGQPDHFEDGFGLFRFLRIAGVERRDRCDQFPGIVMLRIVEHIVRIALFDDLAELHDRNPVGDFRHDAEIVG